MFERLVWLVPVLMIVAGVARPRAGLVVLAACLPFFGTSRGGPYLAAFDAACLAACLLALREPRPQRGGLDRAVLAFLAVGIASCVPLVYHPPSWQPAVLAGLLHALPNAATWSALFTWRALLDALLGAALFFATRRAFAGRSTRPLALGVAAGLALLVGLGLLESAGLVDLGGYRTIAAEGRLHSLFSNSGWLAEYVVVATPFALAPLLAARGAARLAGQALAALCAAALLLSHQRGGWLAALVVCLAAAALLGRRRWQEPVVRRSAAGLLLAATIVSAGLVTARPGFVAGLASRFTQSDLYLRPQMWRAAALAARERPLLGWGVGSYEIAVSAQASAASIPASAHGEAHNTILQIATERGLAGLAALALLALATLDSARRGLAQGGDERPLALGRALSLCGLAAYALVQYVLFVPPVAALAWMVVGCDPPPAAGAGRLLRRPALALSALALLLATWRAFGPAPAPAPGDRSFGFHAPEPLADGSLMEWTEGHAARRLACSGRWLVLDLANGHPAEARRPIRVGVRADGAAVAAPQIRGGRLALRVPLGEACADGSVVVQLSVSPTFRPFSAWREDPALPRSNDERELGVIVRRLAVE